MQTILSFYHLITIMGKMELYDTYILSKAQKLINRFTSKKKNISNVHAAIIVTHYCSVLYIPLNK